MAVFSLDALAVPIVQAPMAGGPSTPGLAAAVSAAGGLGFLAGGYRTADELQRDIGATRSLLPGDVAFGVNVFAAPGHGAGAGQVAAYAATLRGEAELVGTAFGEPRWDDDHYAEKLDLLCAERVPVVSFTFGCPAADEVQRLHRAGSAVWVTATTPDEASAAAAAGADAVVAQGVEAGGHRGSFDDGMPGDLGLLALLQLVRSAVGEELPVVAGGGIATGAGIAAVLVAGATAAQLGTAFMLCAEAGTPPAQRAAIKDGRATTALTRAFTGRTARGIVNRFLREHSADAPSAYPEVHHLTAPMRAAARQRGDADGFNLWAGQAYPLTRSLPAAQLVADLAAQAQDALAAATRRARPSDAAAGTPSVLVLGFDPYRVPGPWDPKPVADGIEAGRRRFDEHGVGVEFCLFGLDGSDDVEAVVAAALRSRPWRCVVIGGGVRNDVGLFERIIDLVQEHCPGAALAFNATPADTLDAALRGLARSS